MMRRTGETGRRTFRKATALLVVVAVIAVLVPLVLHYHRMSSDRYRMARTIADRTRGRAVARCGLALALEVLSSDDRPYFFLPHNNPERPTRVEGRPSDLERAYLWFDRSRKTPKKLADGLVRIRIEDDQGKLPLNRMGVETLAAFFRILGLKSNDITRITEESRIKDLDRRLAAELVDWRDRDSFVTWGIGAEDARYLEHEPPYRCRNSAIHSLGELSLLAHCKDDMLRRTGLDDLATVFGPGPIVNANTAPAAVLASLPGICGSGDEAAIVAGIIRNRPFRTMASLRSSLESTIPGIWGKIFRHLTLDSNRFSIEVTGRCNGVDHTLKTTVQIMGSRILVLSWKERPGG